ncbi:MAG: mitochondrial fission ELM1 family protein [Pseudomonadota bacterium]
MWAVSDGRAGNAAQVRAIANALGSTLRWMQIAHIAGEGHRDQPLTLTPRAPWTWLPSKAWRAPLLALPKDQRSALAPPWPTIWLGAGRRTAPYSAEIKRRADDETLVVHILDPKMDPAAFDLLVTPQHDGLSGANVISTVGSPSYFSPDDMEEAGQAFADLADEPGKSALIILGGDSKTHTFTQGAAETLAMQLSALAGKGWRLRMTASRRTPAPVQARMRVLADQIGARFWAGPGDEPNPYLAWLMFSDVAIVTEDSANMLSDAAYHGLPVHIARLHGRAPKFDRLHDSLIQRGVARWFDGDLQSWSFEPLREADRVADAIVAKLLERHPQPNLGNEGKVVAPDWL